MASWLACSPACACIVSMMCGPPSSFSGQHCTLGQRSVLHAGEGASAIRMRWRRCEPRRLLATRATEAVVHHTLQRAPWTTLPRERGVAAAAAAAGGGARLHLAILETAPSWQACVVPRLHPGLLPGRPHWEQGRSCSSRWDTFCLLYPAERYPEYKKNKFAPLLRLFVGSWGIYWPDCNNLLQISLSRSLQFFIQGWIVVWANQ
jgi:hypothetical protein